MARSRSGGWMGLGLRVLNRIGGSPLLDRLGLRALFERSLYHGARSGFGTAARLRRWSRGPRLAAPLRPTASAAGAAFDLTPSDEQQLLRAAAAEFAREQLRPAALAADRACAAQAPVLAGLQALGLAQLAVPEALGGAGNEHSAVTQALIVEALAHGDMGLAVAGLAPVAVARALSLWGDAEQQARYLPAFAAETPPVAALAMMEPQPLFDPLQPQTRARRVDDGWRLDGVKALVPGAAAAELLLVAAAVDGEGGEPALFVVEAGTAGLTVEAEPAMGLRAAQTGRLQLRRVALPAGARLTRDAAAYTDCVLRARLAWCALAIGTAQAALDHVIPYVNERIAFGEPISHRQAVAFTVADIATELEGMRLALWRAAARADRGVDFARETALARRLCAEHGMRIGSQALQLLGGHGYVQEYPVERWYRDLRGAGLMEGAVLL